VAAVIAASRNANKSSRKAKEPKVLEEAASVRGAIRFGVIVG
jgi:hypothetical protein